MVPEIRGMQPQMALDSRDADFFQVALSEGQEDLKVHVLFLKQLQVLQTPYLLQQCGKVLVDREARTGWQTGRSQRHGDKKRHMMQGGATFLLLSVHL